MGGARQEHGAAIGGRGMDALFGLMGDWPKWAVYAVVGGILGGSGALVGWLLERLGIRFGRFAVVLGIAATPVVSREVVLPQIIEAYSNLELPRKIDEFTTLTRIEFGAKRYVYLYDLSSDVNPSFDVAEIKREGLADMCNYWKPAFDDGEVISAEYRYRINGDSRSFFVTASDC